MPGQGINVEREQTEQFIDQNPTMITFTRNTKVPDGAGGGTYTPTPLPPQKVRVIAQSRLVSVERRNVHGATVRPDMNLLALWDADIQRGDTFSLNNMDMEVIWVNVLPYEVMAEVAVR